MKIWNSRLRALLPGNYRKRRANTGVNTDGSTPSSAWISWHDATKFRRPKSNFVAQPRNWWPDRTGATLPPLSAVVRRPIQAWDGAHPTAAPSYWASRQADE